VPRLSIVASSDGVVLNQQLRLTATMESPNGQSVPVQPTWSSEMPSVAPVDSNGIVTGLALGTSTITATYESQSATYQLSVVNDFSGGWTGKYRIRNCTRISGAGSSYCRFVLGAVLPIQLTVTQDGKAVTGTINFYDNLNRLLLNGPITGSSLVSGELRISATVHSVGNEQPETTTVSDWVTRLSGDAREMIGEFVMNREFVNAFGPQKSREDCAIEYLSRL
jgi:hypothetical protein